MKKLFFSTVLVILVFCLAACSKPAAETPTEQADQTPVSDTAAQNESEFKEVEVKEFGYSLNGEYLYYSVILHNPNESTVIDLPSFKIVAKDAEGGILGVEEQTLSAIYPGQDFAYAFMGFEVESAPETVDIEIVKSEEYNIKDISTMEHNAFVPLEVTNAKVSDDRVLGEIENKNDYDIDSAVVSILYRDADGKLIGGTSTFIDDIKANGSTAFDFSTFVDFATENYELFANNWG